MEDSALKAGGRKIPVSNLDKVLYPGGRFTKAKVLEYYGQIATVLLPHFKARPVTLVRYPDGVFKEAFYEKNAPGFTPEWVQTFPVPRSQGGVINYILINDLPTLLWVANLAALELHPFLHRAPHIERPTHCVFDLDPGEGADILACAETAFVVREVLEGFKLKSFPKVSGSKGIQLYVPLNTPVTYDTTHAFARAVAELLTRQHPNSIVADMSKALRRDKVFIDWSQNNQSKTTVGVYSLRAKQPEPFVSMPVTWSELKLAILASNSERLFFSPEAALARIKKQGDLFAPVLRLQQRLPPRFLSSLSGSTEAKPLARYAAKRDFARTSEPEPVFRRRSAQGSRRRFVVQKHAARHLHYDFRLEIHDVLKSWAVPKGLPLKQGERHSGFATEDHPLEYLQFEGVIPQGQYGGGTVMLWDIGTYDLVQGNYWKGDLNVFLSGAKLKGEWSLKRLEGNANGDGKAVWLVSKVDNRAKRVSAKRMELSALTGRSMDQIATEKTAVWHSNRAPIVTHETQKPGPKLPRAPASGFVPPMKATLVDQLPAGPAWMYEIKWDGYRALGSKHGEVVRLLSLKDKNLASDFPSVAEAISALKAEVALLDGEIVAVDKAGRPSFQALQNRASLGRDWLVVYYAFDLLNLEGTDLRKLPLVERRARLKSLLEGTDLRFSAELSGTPDQIIEVARQNGLEGIIAKRKDSTYSGAARTVDWRKFKLNLAQEFVIGGYNPEPQSFSSLLVGYNEGQKLMFAGKVRQGLNPASRAALARRLKPLRIKHCPFANLPISKTGHFGEGITSEDMAKLHWVRPTLVAQVSFTEWTSYGLLRHATFLGLRQDKDPREVVREAAFALVRSGNNAHAR